MSGSRPILPPAAGGAAALGSPRARLGSKRIPDGNEIIARKRTTPRNEAGTALVEFALVLPLFLVLLLGMVDFGKGLNYWIDQTHLANQAARFATVDRNPGAVNGRTLQQYIRDSANTGELAFGGTESVDDPLAVCISFPEGNTDADPAVPGDPVTVKIKTTYNWIPFLDANIGVSAVAITGSATMRLEAKPTAYKTTDNSAGC